MQIDIIDPPRVFKVKDKEKKDCARVYLESDEQVTFMKGDKEFDFASTEWGFYATPSINGRVKDFGFKTAVVLNEQNRLYINIVEIEKVESFKKFIKNKGATIVCWLDQWLD
jgi:hypothetical protein